MSRLSGGPERRFDQPLQPGLAQAVYTCPRTTCAGCSSSRPGLNPPVPARPAAGRAWTCSQKASPAPVLPGARSRLRQPQPLHHRFPPDLRPHPAQFRQSPAGSSLRELRKILETLRPHRLSSIQDQQLRLAESFTRRFCPVERDFSRLRRTNGGRAGIKHPGPGGGNLEGG